VAKRSEQEGPRPAPRLRNSFSSFFFPSCFFSLLLFPSLKIRIRAAAGTGDCSAATKAASASSYSPPFLFSFFSGPPPPAAVLPVLRPCSLLTSLFPLSLFVSPRTCQRTAMPAGTSPVTRSSSSSLLSLPLLLVFLPQVANAEAATRWKYVSDPLAAAQSCAFSSPPLFSFFPSFFSLGQVRA